MKYVPLLGLQPRDTAAPRRVCERVQLLHRGDHPMHFSDYKQHSDRLLATLEFISAIWLHSLGTGSRALSGADQRSVCM